VELRLPAIALERFVTKLSIFVAVIFEPDVIPADETPDISA
jgi:hypothetical protein